ncbi:MAG: ATP-binding protein [Gammaproteobacteria bacterium]|nr:ATP-binding protein [Gammaproteobacteria bacterium]MCH9744969.1 ATP-binding protein [Gammaproteobacteria bacterium]
MNKLGMLIDEFRESLDLSYNYTERASIKFANIEGKIKVAIGMRRAGKTVALLQQVQKLIAKGVAPEQILFIDFEDDRLLPMGQSELAQLIDAFYQRYPENHDRQCYIFLDEIQNVDNWALVVRRFFNNKRLQIYLSGSSAKLLSKEIASSLRGRSIATEVWPFNFHEYLAHQKLTLPKKSASTKAKHQYRALLEKYLNVGGFPEVVSLTEEDRARVLQDYVSVVILRDIIERYNISNIESIRYMIKTLLKNAATPFSINKFYNDIKSQGFTIGRNTLYDYLSYIEDAYLAFTVPLYDASLRKVNTNPRKTYSIDTGLINTYIFGFSKSYGQLFENLIYIDLRRRQHEIYYYLTKERYEIDFVTRSATGDMKCYQVAWDLENSETMQREQRALDAAEQELGIKGIIITPDNYLDFLDNKI